MTQHQQLLGKIEDTMLGDERFGLMRDKASASHLKNAKTPAEHVQAVLDLYAEELKPVEIEAMRIAVDVMREREDRYIRGDIVTERRGPGVRTRTVKR